MRREGRVRCHRLLVLEKDGGHALGGDIVEAELEDGLHEVAGQCLTAVLAEQWPIVNCYP
jgi:hypothetical protein